MDGAWDAFSRIAGDQRKAHLDRSNNPPMTTHGIRRLKSVANRGDRPTSTGCCLGRVRRGTLQPVLEGFAAA